MAPAHSLLCRFQSSIVESDIGESELSSIASACGISRSDIDNVTVAKQSIALVLLTILQIDESFFESDRNVVINNCTMKCRVKNPCIDDELDATEWSRGRTSKSTDSGCVSLDESICIAEDESDGQFVRVKLPMEKQQQLRSSSNRCFGRVQTVRDDPRCRRKKKTQGPYWCYQHESQHSKYESWLNNSQDRDEIEQSYPWFSEVSIDISELCDTLAGAGITKNRRSTQNVLSASASNSARLSGAEMSENDLKAKLEIEFQKFSFTLESAAAIAAHAIDSGSPQHLMCAEWAIRWLEREWPALIAQLDYQVDANNHFRRSTITEIIKRFGFSPDSADEYTERIFASGAPYHLGVVDWLTRLIEEIDSKTKISTPVLQCMLGGSAVSVGGTLPSTSQSVGTVSASSVVKHIDYTLADRTPWKEVKKRLSHDGKTGYKPYFHATNSKDAECLASLGIGIPLGRQFKDFSHGDGFYLHTNWLKAAEWARQGGSVLLYLTPPNYLETACDGYLDLTNDLAMWERVVRYYRTGKANGGRFSEFADVAALVEGKGFIRGHIADSTDQLQSNEDWRNGNIRSLYSDAVQVCIKTTALAAQLHRTLFAVFHIK